MIIILPWPDKRLSPNARLHWRAKVGPKQDAKRQAAWLTIATDGFYAARDAISTHDGKIPVKVTFYPPDARHRDDDNMIGSFKSWRDGIADALSFDDRRIQPEYHFADPKKPGRIEVELFTDLWITSSLRRVAAEDSCAVSGDRPFQEAVN